MFRCGGGCGCCNSCGCCDSCGDSCGGGCGCGGDNGGEKHEEAAPAAPAEAGASMIRPIPPRPMSDPNASVGHQRNVVRTSFVR
jgi:hypothetical protein